MEHYPCGSTVLMSQIGCPGLQELPFPSYFCQYPPYYWAMMNNLRMNEWVQQAQKIGSFPEFRPAAGHVKDEFVGEQIADSNCLQPQSKQSTITDPIRKEKLPTAFQDLDGEVESTSVDPKAKTVHKNAFLSYTFNKVIKFIRTPQSSGALVRQLLSNAGLEERKYVSAFYKYATETTKKILNAVSIHKIRGFWMEPAPSQGVERKIFHSIFRALSWQFLQRHFPAMLYEDERLTPIEREKYLRMRQCLLTNLKSPAEFTSYVHF